MKLSLVTTIATSGIMTAQVAVTGKEKNSMGACKEQHRFCNMVIDAGPLINGTAGGFMNMADKFFTTPAVVAEVRDSKARRALETLPYDLIVKAPPPEAINAVIAFARASGDLR